MKRIEKGILSACVIALAAYALSWLSGDAPCLFCTAPTTEVITDSSSDIGTSSVQALTVKRVIDGDTIELDSGEKIRYIGIDTPESVDPRRPVECFGKEAAEQNKKLVLNKAVRLERDVSNKDKYGRLLRYVYVGDTFVNLALVRLGYANSSSYPPDVRYQDRFREAERTAKAAGLGLWSGCQE